STHDVQGLRLLGTGRDRQLGDSGSIGMSDYDVVFVGSGVAAATAGAQLAAAGISVAFLEAGPRTKRNESVQRFRDGLYPYESPPWAPQPTFANLNHYYVQAGKGMFGSGYERRVGGTTWHWLGTCPRL